MKLVHSWAQKFVAMPTPARVRDILDAAGLPVESIDAGAVLPATVVVGHVRDVRKHPNADRLRVTSVDVGEGNARTIICGAPNVAAGQKVCVALPGSVLPNGVVIATTTLRGIRSEGMICSARELGLDNDHAGILTLPSGAAIGSPVSEALPGEETVYDVAVTPNRADCLSVFGLAREIAAAEKRAVRRPHAAKLPRAKSPLRVSIQARTQCPYYSALRLTNVRVAPSPDWLAARVRAAGLRPVSNVVDVTNYCMLELGQPLHAFDADNISAPPSAAHLIVRCAKKGEVLQTLDGIRRTLHPSMLVVADEQQPVALAGVLGGEQTGVTEKTTDVILESALFAKQTVYDTARALQISSESAQRFSKSVDPAMVPVALARAATLLCELAGARIVGSPAVAGALPKSPHTIILRVAWLNAFLGTALKPATVRAVLKRLGMTLLGTGDRLRVTPPSSRQDIALPEDLAEEVARAVGYNTLPRTVPRAPGLPMPQRKRVVLVRTLTEQLVRAGAHEHIGHAYVPQSMVTDMQRAVAIRNPLSRDQAYLRTSLAPGLYTMAGRNAKRYDNFRIFEVGKEYRTTPTGFEEKEVLVLLWAERRAVRTLKGALQDAVERSYAGVALSFRPAHAASVAILIRDQLVGMLTEPDERDRATHKLPPSVAFAALDLDRLERVLPAQTGARYRPPAAFPAVKRDIAFWVAKDVPYATLEEAIRGASPLLVHVELFDVFEQGKRRSMAFHLRLQAPDHTLSSAEAETLLSRVRERLQQRCGAELRQA